MADNIITRTRKAWNIFLGREDIPKVDIGTIGYTSRPDRPRFTLGNERSIINALYTRIAIDASTVRITHARINENRAFQEEIPSALNQCLSVEANIDQSAQNFILDAVVSLCDEGTIAIVPVDTTGNPNEGTYDIHTMRVGRILEWHPSYVKVRLYNDRTGEYQEVDLSKTIVAIVENPFYSVMNEPNSILRRLIEKINLLDAVDRKTGGKLDLIIQLPFLVRTETKKKEADKRRKEIQEQLETSEYGIAYTDATERITQLNRPVENTLLTQVESLTTMLYSQLGMSEAVVNGTASEIETMNYFTRTIDPIVTAITSAMYRVFLTKTARTQGQAIIPFRAAFRYVTPSILAEFADKFTRNEVLSSNEVRSMIGYYPSSDPKADELRNKNLNKQQSNTQTNQNGSEGSNYDDKEEV